MAYMYSATRVSYEVIENGKDYSVPKIALYDSKEGDFEKFWSSLPPKEKKIFLVTKNQSNKINNTLGQELFTLAALDQAYKAATEPGEPIVPGVKYKYSDELAGFSVEDGVNVYFVPQTKVKNYNGSFAAFWSDTPDWLKYSYLVAPLKSSNKVYPDINPNVSSLMEALTKRLPKQAELPFASLQEMYDSGKPTKKVKGAAKSLGKKIKYAPSDVNSDPTHSEDEPTQGLELTLSNWPDTTIEQTKGLK